MNISERPAVFDYRALRLLMGLFAFTMPFVVSLLANKPLTSISAAYHSDARDAFVGMLCIVAAFLWAYNGHSNTEAALSKIAAIAAALVALLPTRAAGESLTWVAIGHYVAAALLFAILAYFCLGPFRQKIKKMSGKKGRRDKIYLACGLVIAFCIGSIFVAGRVLSEQTMDALRFTYWAEAIALGAFGVAWIVAGKCFSFFTDADEMLILSPGKSRLPMGGSAPRSSGKMPSIPR